MLEHRLVLQIVLLLSQKKYSQRQIAKMMGVSRGTVNAIARGKRQFTPKKAELDENKIPLPRGEPCRCPLCGAMVRMPCLACTLRRIAKKRKRNSEDFTA